jgi:acyl-CoA synthetase (AMP-forming)/AMP-acid ligase II/aryl carrier-like protein
VFRQYALAEVGGIAMLARVEDDDADVQIVGRPATSRLGVRILDADMALVAPGEVGELYLSGVPPAAGDGGRIERTSTSFVCDPHVEQPGALMVSTGDLARRRPDGGLELLGRVHDEVWFRGFRLTAKLESLESALARHPALLDVAVCLDGPGDALVAYVVARHRDPPSPRDIDLWVKRTMPDWLLPVRYVAVEEIPLRVDGRPARDLLAVAAGRALGAEDDRSASQADAEQKLAAIWKKVLGRRRVERSDNFFRSGGDLICAVEMVTRAEQAGLPVTIANLIEGPTIAELAAALEGVR